MGYIAASIVHEVKQPIAAMVANAEAALRWLDRPVPEVDGVRQALRRIVRNGARTAGLLGPTRDLATRRRRQNDRVAINAMIGEAIDLSRAEAAENGVSVQTEFVETLPPVQGDPAELQQVVLNLMINAIETMSAMNEARRELIVSTNRTEASGVLVSELSIMSASSALALAFAGLLVCVPDGSAAQGFSYSHPDRPRLHQRATAGASKAPATRTSAQGAPILERSVPRPFVTNNSDGLSRDPEDCNNGCLDSTE
jgi:hypothetical protein